MRSGVRSRAAIVDGLAAQGLVFRSFAITEDAGCSLTDADWNQRDLAHVPHVHGGFRAIAAASDEDAVSLVYLQQLLPGVRVPLAVAFHQRSPTERIYHATLGPFALVVEATLTARSTSDGDEGCDARTTYSLGGPRWLAWALPLGERWLRRNHARLEREDAPMRARRVELRRWGYRFGDDGAAGYASSLDVGQDRVIAPPASIVDSRRVPATSGLVGRSDHLGLRLVRDGDELRVYPRLCRHAGACLDDAREVSGALSCPWHGRRVAPLARLRVGTRDTVATADHQLALDGDDLTIAPRASVRARKEGPP